MSPRLKQFMAALVTGLGAWSCVAAPALPALGVKGDAVTVSGISSGGYMAVQYQVAYSRQVKGAGVLAAGPYDCAEGSTWRALVNCMSPTRWAPVPEVGEIRARMESRARLGLIDPPAGLADDRVWVLTGASDHTVERPVVDALVDFYRNWMPAESVTLVTLPEAGHAMISVTDPSPNACSTSEPPFINRCGDFDAAGELLKYLLGPLQAPAALARQIGLQTFDQAPFIRGLPADAGLAGQGFVYVPASCRSGGCQVHVAFHGCRQGEDQVGRRFVEGAGYNRWAESNRLVVLYPQVAARNGLAAGSWRWMVNPKGCWDWWGYASADYATRNGLQLEAVHKMLQRLAEPPGR